MLRFLIILDFFLALGVGACVYDILTIDTAPQIPEYEKQLAAVRHRYKWITPRLFETIYDQSSKLPFEKPALLVAAIIQAESEGKRWATGPKVRHYSYRARGLMQVMPFWVKRRDVPKLYDPEFNVRTGIKILTRYATFGDIPTTLKNYNSGPASRYYNWPYIRKILRDYQFMVNASKHLTVERT